MTADKVSNFYLDKSGKAVPSKSWEMAQVIVIFNSAATHNPEPPQHIIGGGDSGHWKRDG